MYGLGRLLYNLDFADNRQLFCLTLAGVDNTDDCQSRDGKSKQTGDDGDNYRSGVVGVEVALMRNPDKVEQNAQNAVYSVDNQKIDALLCMEACELGLSCAKERNKYEQTEVGQYCHEFVFGDVARVVFRSCVCHAEESAGCRTLLVALLRLIALLGLLGLVTGLGLIALLRLLGLLIGGLLRLILNLRLGLVARVGSLGCFLRTAAGAKAH